MEPKFALSPNELHDLREQVIKIIGDDFQERLPMTDDEFLSFLKLIHQFDDEINCDRKLRKLIIMFIFTQLLYLEEIFCIIREGIISFFTKLKDLTEMESAYAKEVKNLLF